MKKIYKQIIDTFDYSLDVSDTSMMMKVLDPDLKPFEVLEHLHQQFYEELHFAFLKLNATFDIEEARSRLEIFKKLLEDD